MCEQKRSGDNYGWAIGILLNAEYDVATFCRRTSFILRYATPNNVMMVPKKFKNVFSTMLDILFSE